MHSQTPNYTVIHVYSHLADDVHAGYIKAEGSCSMTDHPISSNSIAMRSNLLAVSILTALIKATPVKRWYQESLGAK